MPDALRLSGLLNLAYGVRKISNRLLESVSDSPLFQCDQPITDAGFRNEMLRLRWIVFEFLA